MSHDYFSFENGLLRALLIEIPSIFILHREFSLERAGSAASSDSLAIRRA